MIRFISLLVSIPLVILIAAFTYNNAQLVSIDLFITQIQLPQALLLLIALLTGFILGYFFNIMAILNLKRKQTLLARKNKALKDLPDILKNPNQNK